MTAADLLVAFELHAPERIQALLDRGLDPRAPISGKAPLTWLIEMYTRSDRFPACVRLLLDRGATLEDPALVPVLMDDDAGIEAAIRAQPSLVAHRTTLRSAFTPLAGATLLHVAAEYGHLRAARRLLAMGADVNARANMDEHGLNGHTPIFHAVNSSGNRSLPVLELLLQAGARTDIVLHGITWGKGFDWETTLFDVTPISYAQAGLLPQMHRSEPDTWHNVRRLLTAASRPVPPLDNVPNRYLRKPASAGEAADLDALRAAPEHHALVLENERVRVLDTRIPPGQRTRLHTHQWPAVLHIRSWSAFVRRNAQGEVEVDSRAVPALANPPDVLWIGPLGPHSLENVGENDLHVLSVEIKQEP